MSEKLTKADVDAYERDHARQAEKIERRKTLRLFDPILMTLLIVLGPALSVFKRKKKNNK